MVTMCEILLSNSSCVFGALIAGMYDDEFDPCYVCECVCMCVCICMYMYVCAYISCGGMVTRCNIFLSNS